MVKPASFVYMVSWYSVAANPQNNGVRCQIPQTGSIVDFPRLVLLDLAINIISDTTIIKKNYMGRVFIPYLPCLAQSKLLQHLSLL